MRPEIKVIPIEAGFVLKVYDGHGDNLKPFAVFKSGSFGELLNLICEIYAGSKNSN